MFWKTFKPLFSSSQANNEIMLVEGEEIISDDKQIAECFNSYFANIVDTLNIPPDVIAIDYEPIDDPVLNPINKYANHQSKLRIKESFTSWEPFEFSKVNHTLVYSEIMHLDKTKKTSGHVPVDMLKLSANLCHKEITFHINKAINDCNFPSDLKVADVSPIFKTDDSAFKKNYRPISVLPCISKIFERVLNNQMVRFMKERLSDLLCGFREKDRMQHALITLIESCRNCLDNKGVVGMVQMDLSKAHDCLPHDLFIAKLAAYGFGGYY